MTEENEIVEPLSIRDTLAAALTDDTAGVTPMQSIPAPKPEVRADAASIETPEPRDEQGKFAKSPDAVQAKVEPKTTAADEPPKETIVPPAAWSATAKADFAALAPHIQQEVLKREKDIENGKAQWDQKAQRFNRLDAVLAPRRERFQLAGVDEAQAVQQLFAAADLLERDGPAGIMYLARQYGVDLMRMAQQMAGQQPQPAQMSPELAPLMQQVQTLTQTVAQQQQAHLEAQRSGYVSQVQTFAADPSNIYFENVKDQMAKLIRTEQAKDLQDAYDQATWANPEIRAILIRQQAEQAQSQTQEQQRAKAAQAKHASGSINGSPSPGASGQAGSAATVRDALMEAYRAAT